MKTLLGVSVLCASFNGCAIVADKFKSFTDIIDLREYHGNKKYHTTNFKHIN
jgi:hypothetical protein